GRFSGPAPNTSFTVSETVPGSFVPVDPTSCVAGFAPGCSATCAFTDQAKGQIVVTKQVEGGNGSFTFSLTPGGSSIILSGGAAGTTVSLHDALPIFAPNTSFTVSETVPGSFVPV